MWVLWPFCSSKLSQLFLSLCINHIHSGCNQLLKWQNGNKNLAGDCKWVCSKSINQSWGNWWLYNIESPNLWTRYRDWRDQSTVRPHPDLFSFAFQSFSYPHSENITDNKIFWERERPHSHNFHYGIKLYHGYIFTSKNIAYTGLSTTQAFRNPLRVLERVLCP